MPYWTVNPKTQTVQEVAGTFVAGTKNCFGTENEAWMHLYTEAKAQVILASNKAIQARKEAAQYEKESLQAATVAANVLKAMPILAFAKTITK